MEVKTGCPRIEFPSSVITNHVLTNKNYTTFIYLYNMGHSEN